MGDAGAYGSIGNTIWGVGELSPEDLFERLLRRATP